MESVFLIAGERSGDRHGAGLMEEMRTLQPGIALHGLGGPRMREISDSITDWVEEAGVVGLVEVLRKYGWFRARFAETLDAIARLRPDAVVLIDYPGFNLRIARALRKSGYQGRIIYYISPQVWAWHRGRIPAMARCLDLMICIFPFEADLYRTCGLKAVFCGHPLVEYHRQRAAGSAREPGLIGLLPGSRRREIAKLFPAMLQAAALLHRSDPGLRFVASAASEPLARTMRAMTEESPVPNLTIETGNAYSLMERAECGVVASGTATLEAAIYGLPHCLVYRVSWGTWLAAKLLMKVDWLGIVNILAGREVVRELLQRHCTPQSISRELLRLHADPHARESLAAELRTITSELAGEGAYRRAAEAVLARPA